MLSDGALQRIPGDGEADIEDYNIELDTLKDCTWLQSPWLYTECYMYRILHTFFSMSTPFWQSFDLFTTSKQQSLVDSKKGTIELVKRFRGMLKAIADKEAVDEATQKAIFEEMVQICLWGNATDLSLLTSLSVEELDSRQGKAVRESSKKTWWSMTLIKSGSCYRTSNLPARLELFILCWTTLGSSS